MPAPYSLEFKKKAVRAANNRGDKTLGEVAEKLGIAVPTLASWRLTLGEVEPEAAAAPELPKTNGHAEPATPKRERSGSGDQLVSVFDELAKLRTENAELRSLLKKLL
jgi:transposase-like protein